MTSTVGVAVLCFLGGALLGAALRATVIRDNSPKLHDRG